MIDFDSFVIDAIVNNSISEDAPACVVRLKTDIWNNDRGLHVKKSITFLKRLSAGFNILHEELSNVGGVDTLKSIINFDECKDGIYEIITVNESNDWESGQVDGYDLKLIPYEVNNVKNG